MRKYDDSERSFWHLVPVNPAFVTSFRRWNVVISSALSFIVLGVFVMVFTHPGHAAISADGVSFKVEQGSIPFVTLLDAQTQNLTPMMARKWGILGSTQGVLVTSVETPNAAEPNAGLNRGDVIQQVNGKPVRNVKEFRQAVDRLHGKRVLLLVSRAGSTRFVVIQPQ